MPVFRCDFHVRSDVLLPEGAPPVVLQAPDPFTVRLYNGKQENGENPRHLVATVVGPSAELEHAVDQFRALLASRLDLLSILTNDRFLIKGPIRLIDWEPYQVDRRIRIFSSFGPLDRPQPVALGTIVESVAILAAMPIPAALERALQHYRLGILSDHEEDQFRHLWLALEIVADHVKAKTAEPTICSACGDQMRCAACGNEPTRRPMAVDEIRSMMREVLRGDVDAAIKVTIEARNGLTHGRSVKSIEEKCGLPFSLILKAIGDTTWRWILFSLGHRNNPAILVEPERNYSNHYLTVSPVIGFRHEGGEPHPADDMLPSATLSLEFGVNPSANEDFS